MRLVGSVMAVSAEHDWNALVPMEVMVAGNDTEVRPEQFLKALLPMAVTSYVTLSKVTVPGIVTEPV